MLVVVSEQRCTSVTSVFRVCLCVFVCIVRGPTESESVAAVVSHVSSHPHANSYELATVDMADPVSFVSTHKCCCTIRAISMANRTTTHYLFAAQRVITRARCCHAQVCHSVSPPHPCPSLFRFVISSQHCCGSACVCCRYECTISHPTQFRSMNAVVVVQRTLNERRHVQHCRTSRRMITNVATELRATWLRRADNLSSLFSLVLQQAACLLPAHQRQSVLCCINLHSDVCNVHRAVLATNSTIDQLLT